MYGIIVCSKDGTHIEFCFVEHVYQNVQLLLVINPIGNSSCVKFAMHYGNGLGFKSKCYSHTVCIIAISLGSGTVI